MSASHPGRPSGWCNETNALHCCHVVDGIKGPLYHDGQNSAKENKTKKQKRLFSRKFKGWEAKCLKVYRDFKGALLSKCLNCTRISCFLGKSLQYASKMNKTLVFQMSLDGPGTPLAFVFFFCCFFSFYMAVLHQMRILSDFDVYSFFVIKKTGIGFIVQLVSQVI